MVFDTASEEGLAIDVLLIDQMLGTTELVFATRMLPVNGVRLPGRLYHLPPTGTRR